MGEAYLQEAFNRVCTNAKVAEGSYVCLMKRVSRYGGPEEGGWWTEDVYPVAYQWFATEEAANAACDAVEKLAKQLTDFARTDYGEHCLRQMDWCEARGLDADYLPEPDGPDEYYVYVGEGVPEATYGPRRYE